MTEMKKNSIIISLLYILGIFVVSGMFGLFVYDKSSTRLIVTTIYNIIVIIVAFVIKNPFQLSKETLIEEKNKSLKKYNIKKWCVIAAFVIIIFYKLFLIYKLNYVIDSEFSIFPKQNVLIIFVSFITGGIAEEFLFKSLIYTNLKRLKVPVWLAIFITAFLFATAHWIFGLKIGRAHV